MHYFERSPWVLLLSLCAELLVYFPIHLDSLHFCVFSELSKQLGPYVSTSSCKYLINLKLPVIELGLSPPDIFWMPFYVSFATESESPRSIRQRQPGMHSSSHTRSKSIIFILPAKIFKSSHLKLTEIQIKQKAVVGFGSLSLPVVALRCDQMEEDTGTAIGVAQCDWLFKKKLNKKLEHKMVIRQTYYQRAYLNKNKNKKIIIIHLLEWIAI